ncbi:hypothetical protein [Metallosphaera sp.]|uniref:hypothetical protein n=1 Tax=Metallosphaera sp. TaxID=2020860 RepID=UPI00317BF33E
MEKMEMEKKEIVNSDKNMIVEFSDDDIVEYEVYVEVVVLDWYNVVRAGKFHFRTSVQQFQEIFKNPLRDYIEFGVQDVLYAFLKYYPVYFKNGMEIIAWGWDGYTYAFSENFERYKEQVDKILENLVEENYVNIRYHD